MNRAEIEWLADRLLLLIRTRPGERFLRGSLADELGVSADAVAAAVTQLERWGYSLGVTGEELRLFGVPDSLTATELGWGLETRCVGRRILAFNQVKSTNDVAAREGEAGAVEGTVVVADQQTAGRGRLGRVWYSPPGAGIYLSILLRPRFLPEDAPGLSLVTALALAEAVETSCNVDAKIKWPNDIIVNERKVAGILTEMSAEQGIIHYVVIGVGINANHMRTDFPEGLVETATSLRIESEREISRVRLTQQFFRGFEREYEAYAGELLVAALPRIRKRSTLLGNIVKLDTGRGLVAGRAVDLDARGRLVVEREGTLMVVSAGDVTVVKER